MYSGFKYVIKTQNIKSDYNHRFVILNLALRCNRSESVLNIGIIA